MTDVQTYRPSRSDRVGLGAFVAIGVILLAGTLWKIVARIVEVAPNHNVKVLGEFAGTRAHAPIGPDGASMTVELEKATLIVPSLPTASWIALILQQVIFGVAAITVTICLIWLIRGVAAGHIFSRRNTKLVACASICGFVAYVVVPFLGNMVANGGFARISGGSFDNVVISAQLSGAVIFAFLAAIACVVFTIGDRLRSDAEGLV